MSAYEKIASIYDELMVDVDYDGWFEHYLGVLELSGKVSRVLEIGCGTGNFTYRLARHFDVHGVDASASMLQCALQKLQREAPSHAVTFECADMAEFVASGPFDAAVSVFDVLNCADTLPKLQNVCLKVSSVLSPGARFIFDVNTALAFELHLFDEEVVCVDRDYAHVWRGDYDEVHRRETVEMKFYKGADKFCETHVQRAHSKEEIESALKSAGFGNIYFRDAQTMTEPTPQTDRWLVIASKL